MVVAVEGHGDPLHGAAITSFLQHYELPAFVLRVRALHTSHSTTGTTQRDEATLTGANGSSPILAPAPLRTQQLVTSLSARHLGPVSTPTAPPPEIVWSNEPWTSLASGRTLPDLVSRHALPPFHSWVESGRGTYRLLIGGRVPLAMMELLKTPVETGKDYALVAVTAVRIDSQDLKPKPVLKATELLKPSLLKPPSDDRSTSLSSTDVTLTADSDESTAAALLSLVDLTLAVGSPSSSMGSRSSPAPVIIDPDEVKQCHVLIDEIDWSTTAAGPRELWPAEINTMIKLAFSSMTQDAVWVGKDLQMIYNQATTEHVDHPRAFGRPLREVFGGLWDALRPLVEQVMAGTAIHHGNDRLLYTKSERGHYVEKYHSWSWLPILDSKNDVVGVYTPGRDTTSEYLATRRLETTRRLVDEVSKARTTQAFFSMVADVIETNPADAPFLICYSTQPRTETSTVALQSTRSSSTPVQLTLEAAVGVPAGHTCAPQILEARLSGPGVASGTINSGQATRSGTGIERTSSAARMERTAAAAATAERTSAWTRTLGVGHQPPPTANCDQSRAPSPPPSASAGSASLGSSRFTVGYEKSAWPITQALSTRQCILVDNCTEIIKGFPVRQWSELPDQAIVIPLTLSGDDASDVPSGVIIMGLNLYRPMDTEYEDWIQVLRGHLSSALGGVIAFEAEVKQRLAKEKLERAKTAWFRGAAHEFRTPLTLIAGPIDDLLSTAVTKSQRQALILAQRNTQRLKQLVSSILDFSRIEAGHLKAKLVPTDLSAFINNLGIMFRPAVERLHIGFHTEIEPREAPIAVDPVLLETVLSNLLSNALKYTDTGSITLRLTYDSTCANISVIDTGCGVPKGDLEIVTDWFHRSQNVVGRGTAGSGIGLPMAKEFLRLHSGEMLISSKTAEESEDGTHGSKFTARVPLDLEGEEGAEIVRFGSYGRQLVDEAFTWNKDTESDLSGIESGSAPTQGNRSFTDGLLFERSDKLLVVDDNVEVRNYIRLVFQPFCTVLEAATGEEALAIVRSQHPDFVLCDVMLRLVSGLEVLNEIRTDPTMKFTPVMLLSAADDEDLRVTGFLQGADDFMLKPFKPKELLLRVHLHMQMGKKRARLEKLFTLREQEMTVMSDFCPSGIMRTDADGILTYANSAFRECAGPEPFDRLTPVWRTHCDAETWERIEPVWSKILTGKDTTTTIVWRWKTGRAMSGVFIRLDRVRPDMSGVIGCITDITYQEERLVEAERRRVEAEESRHQQELLVDLTSHEIRTPVSAILQCSSLVNENLVALRAALQNSGPEGFHASPELLSSLEEDIEALESIYQCGLVQERIASDVLSLARIQLHMLTLHDVDMDLRQEAQKVLSVFASEARMKKININVEFGASLDALGIAGIKTDPVRLGQVITNLISNAIRFTSASTGRRDITVTYEVSLHPPDIGDLKPPVVVAGVNGSTFTTTVTAEDTPVYLYVSVRDTGPGMSPNEKAVLFQRFQQGNKMIHTRYGGSGLGLFICKQITELLGGDIEVQSDVGCGSDFRFYIKSRTVSIESTRTTSPTPATLEEPDPSLNVLIVEDNAINQTVLKRQILKSGHRCSTADNGQEALDHIHKLHENGEQYDVILMDLEMPVMDGLTAVRHIRAEEAKGVIPPQLVIALTGNARQGQIDQAREAGMDDVIIKPYRLKNLLSSMKERVAARSTQSVEAAEAAGDAAADGSDHSGTARGSRATTVRAA